LIDEVIRLALRYGHLLDLHIDESESPVGVASRFRPALPGRMDPPGGRF
jgi:hypothetical protein